MKRLILPNPESVINTRAYGGWWDEAKDMYGTPYEELSLFFVPSLGLVDRRFREMRSRWHETNTKTQ